MDTNYHRTIPSGEPTPEEHMIHDESMQILMEEIDKLPDKERMAIKMRRLERKTLREVAEEMDATKQAVWVWERNGFDRLQRKVLARIG